MVSETVFFDGKVEREIAPDELLQMFGRAGRRGTPRREGADCGMHPLGAARDRSRGRSGRPCGQPRGPAGRDIARVTLDQARMRAVFERAETPMGG